MLSKANMLNGSRAELDGSLSFVRGVYALVLVVAATHAAAATSQRVQDSIRTKLPSYDPSVRETLEATPANPFTNATSANDSAVPPVEGRTVLLQRLVVRPSDTKPNPPQPLVLPRLHARQAPGPEPEAFLTPEAREAALVVKHLTAFDRKILNRFTLPLFGVSKERRAKDAEAFERGIKQLGEVADLIEISALAEHDPERTAEMKKMYLEAYIARPK